LKAKDTNKIQLLGLMSGTSLDGLDIAHVEFEFHPNQNPVFQIINAQTISYPEALLSKLKTSAQMSSPALFHLHHELGLYYAKCVHEFCENYTIDAAQIAAIAAHGQTIFHQPEQGFTVQIGCGVTLNYHTQIPVINDFRTLDVVAGGQGAPLVPIGDALLFSDQADGFLNLGGFANVSCQKNGTHVAFDIAPANLPLNLWMREIGREFDENGNLASTGKVDAAVLEKLLALPYFTQTGPKSLGTEWMQSQYLPFFDELSLADKLRTHIELLSIITAQDFHQLGLQKVLVTGGGAFNTLLMQNIAEKFNGDLMTPDQKIIAFKEALIFAFLGARFIRKEATTIASVTGASEALCTGTLHDYQGKLSR
jgi:anhydro-N-acetylmuramic acid kinase